MSSYVSSTIEATVHVPFRCVHCSFESVAQVRTKGEGVAGVSWSYRRTLAAADEEARRDGDATAKDLAALATCPQCRRRDEAYRFTVVRNVWLFAIATGLLTGTGVELIARWEAHTSLVEFAIAGAVISALAVVAKHEWRWSEVDERVKVLAVPGRQADAHSQAQQDLSG